MSADEGTELSELLQIRNKPWGKNKVIENTSSLLERLTYQARV